MALTNKGKGILKNREVSCSKTFIFKIPNRSKHEKKFKHAPVTIAQKMLILFRFIITKLFINCIKISFE